MEGIEVNSKENNYVPGEVRMVLIVREDLNMSPGKVAAQCSHAAVSLYKQISESNRYMLDRWEEGGCAKIVLRSKDIEEIEELLMKGVSLNITNYLVIDAGRTEIASGSATVLGLGPAPRAVIDQITKELKLY